MKNNRLGINMITVQYQFEVFIRSVIISDYREPIDIKILWKTSKEILI